MKRLLPAPLLSASLFVLWLVLNPPLGAGQAILGAIVAILLPAVTAPLRPLRVRRRRRATNQKSPRRKRRCTDPRAVG